MLFNKCLVKNFGNVFKLRFKNYCTSFKSSNLKKWRIVFFGTDHFALQSLQQLHKAMQDGVVVKELSVVVPSPKPHPCIVAKYAAQHSIPITIWPLPKETWNGELSEKWDLGVVASFGHLIPKRIITSFPFGILNVHASLLPRWRGAAPIIHAIMNGDIETGITIMLIKPFQFDVGNIVLQEKISIQSQITSVELTDRLARIGASLLLQCVSDLENNLAQSFQQPEEGVTLAPKVDAKISHVDWNTLSASQIYNRWRATQHLFKLQTSFHGDSIKLDGAEPPITPCSAPTSSSQLTTVCRLSEDPTPSSPPGRILVDRKRNLLLIRCREDWALFRRLTIHRKPVMSAVDFVNGYLNKRPVEQHIFTTSSPISEGPS